MPAWVSEAVVTRRLGRPWKIGSQASRLVTVVDCQHEWQHQPAWGGGAGGWGFS